MMPPPSRMVSLSMGSSCSALSRMVAGPPQLKVMTPPARTAPANACSVQEAGVPEPTTEVGRETSWARIGIVQVVLGGGGLPPSGPEPLPSAPAGPSGRAPSRGVEPRSPSQPVDKIIHHATTSGLMTAVIARSYCNWLSKNGQSDIVWTAMTSTCRSARDLLHSRRQYARAWAWLRTLARAWLGSCWLRRGGGVRAGNA